MAVQSKWLQRKDLDKEVLSLHYDRLTYSTNWCSGVMQSMSVMSGEVKDMSPGTDRGVDTCSDHWYKEFTLEREDTRHTLLWGCKDLAVEREEGQQKGFFTTTHTVDTFSETSNLNGCWKAERNISNKTWCKPISLLLLSTETSCHILMHSRVKPILMLTCKWLTFTCKALTVYINLLVDC